MVDEKEELSMVQKNRKNRKRWDQLKFETQCVVAGEDPYPETSHSLRTPIYATKSYAYSSMSEMLENHYFYSRTENPTLYALDQKLATLHHAESALCVASGMGAVHLACSSLLQKRLERVSQKKIVSLRFLEKKAKIRRLKNQVVKPKKG